MSRDIREDRPFADPFASVEANTPRPMVLGQADITDTERDLQIVDATGLLDSLRDAHEEAFVSLARLARVAVVYSSNPQDYEGIVTPARRTRSYKPYEATAAHIGRQLGEIGLRHVTIMDDISLFRTIADHDQPSPHLVWLNTAGVQGRDPMAQTPGLLEAVGIPYIGHRPAAYATSDNKVTAEGVLRAHGVPTPRSIDLSNLNKAGVATLSQRLVAAADRERFAVVKPINGRGSVGVSRIDLRKHTPSTLAEELQELSEIYSGIKVDEFLAGKEVTVSAVRTADHIIVFPPLLRTVDPNTGIFESLDTQAVAGRAAALDSIDPDLSQVAHTTTTAYDALGLEGLARLDLRADTRGVFAVIDVNPKPDLGTADKKSLSEIAAEHSGVPLHRLIEFILLARIDRGFEAHPRFQEVLNG
jgi:D-alanine-D-alanine ligase